MSYQRTLLPSTPVGAPGPLPAEIANLADESLADLSAALGPAAEELGFAGEGFFYIEDPVPPVPLPAEVPMWKLMRFLIVQDMEDAVTAFLAAIPGVEGKVARSDFARAPNFVVGGDFALAFKAAQNISDADWRGMILAANAITG